MSGIALSKYITDWDKRLTDDGTYVVSAEKLAATCTAGEGTGRSYAVKYIPVTGGEFVTFTFTARAISGKGKGSIDYPFLSNGAKDQIDITAPDWREYSISIAVPYYHNDATRYVTCTCGVVNADAGSVEISDLRIDVKDGSRNPLNCVASALFDIRKTGGVVTPSINTNFHYCGIKSVTMSVDTITVTIPNTAPLPSSNMRPIFFAQLTTEELEGWQLKVGDYNTETGTLKIKFVNPSGSYANPTSALTEGQGMFISFMSVGI